MKIALPKMENSVIKNKIIFFIFFNISFLTFGQTEQKLFTLLNSSQTNIVFNNQIEDTKEHNILIYSNYYGGAGVGIADFNNDGLQDVFFAGNLVSDVLYLNLGDMKFKDITTSSGIEDNKGWSSGVVIGDVNNDGWPDVYVTRELYDNNPEILRNKLYINTSKNNKNNEITFKEASKSYGLANATRTRHATFIDYNKDGYLDIFLLNQPPNPGNYSEMFGVNLLQEKYAPRLYKNNGDETFTDVSKKAGVLKPGYANSISVFDANNDGWQDIYMSNDFEAPDAFYINQGDGTFKQSIQESMRHISYFSMGVDAADINNDGNLDLMVVDMAAEDNYRLKSNMSGMNPNSFWEIVNNGGHYQYMFNTLQINQGNFSGTPQFSDVAQMAGVSSTDWSWSNVLADFDNDGYKDVYVTNGLMRDIRNTDSDKAVSKYINQTINEFINKNPNAGNVSIWDILDLKKTLDLIPSEKLINHAYKNIDGLNFKKKSEDWGLNQKSFSAGCAYADLDNDGDLDLVVNNINDKAFVYQNNSNLRKHNFLRVQLEMNKKNDPIQGARVEIIQGNTKQLYEFTSVRGMYSSSEQIAHFGLSSKKDIDSLIVTWPNQEKSVLLSVKPNQLLHIDFDKINSRKIRKIKKEKTVFSSVTSIAYTHKENKFDDYDKQILLPHKLSQIGPALAVGDVNNDGLEDMFVGAAAGFLPELFVQQKSGDFVKLKNPIWNTASKYEDVDAVFFDMDGDGDQDLYVVSGGNEWKEYSENYQDRIYRNEGNGVFVLDLKALPVLTESGSCVRPFDYDNDGDVDLMIGGRHTPWEYPAPTNSRILKNEKGIFKDVTKVIAKDLLNIGLVTDAIWFDFDEDGKTDLVVVGEWMPIRFFKNTGKNFVEVTEKTELKNTEGWWYSINAADMDRDGDLDLVVGNLGLNYKYKATVDEPFEVHYDDFDKNGKKDIVLSYYNFGVQFPLRGRSCSSQQIPKIALKMKSYNIFASSNLEDVYGKQNLKEALHYQAKSFASVYIENKGKGIFEKHTLPKEAQISNINSILLEDFDNDGYKDILIAGNMYPVEIETPRNDSGVGLFLKGNGKGKFSAVPPNESGFFLIGDVKKMKLIKMKKRFTVLSATNNGKLISHKMK